jgi:CheY-like chemotaxis protein
MVVDRHTFDELIKDVLNNFYDVAALETHPLLFSVINIPPSYTGNKYDYVRQLILSSIEQLKPVRKDEIANSPEWRPYYILYKRYEEGLSIQELSDLLAISPRQLRRDHHRAFQALTEILWNRCYASPTTSEDKVANQEGAEIFEIHNEIIDPLETTRGVYNLLKRRFAEKKVEVTFDTPSEPLPVITDRIVVRQMLISLFNEALHLINGSSLHVDCHAADQQVVLEISIPVSKDWEPAGEEEDDDINVIRYWCAYINARLEETVFYVNKKRWLRRSIWLLYSKQKTIFIIDDQEPAINMFKRYLSQTEYLIVGVNRADQALSLARHLQPTLITLDVMMPQMDGWELLQMLKLDEKTHSIPVIVCSAWDDPDLSRSLGAADFLKKPITQKMLLDAIERVLPPTK